ncbi:MAG: hypothetical protein PHI12_08665 [Dehalococcoidales bacterium]|nr:hypothetical protein [Dehalococcoidales bacterium]
MAKVLSVIPKKWERDGKSGEFWQLAVTMTDGTTRGVDSYRELKTGDEIPDSEIKPGKKEGTWVIWSDRKGGGKGNYQRNDDSIRAQCAFKGMVDLIIANKMNVADLNTPTCIKLATIIKNTEEAVKGQQVGLKSAGDAGGAAHAGQLAGQPPSAHGADPSKVPPPPIIPESVPPPIKSMGELRTKIKKTYSTLQTVAAQDSILGKEPITDYDAAFQKVVDYMGKEI